MPKGLRKDNFIMYQEIAVARLNELRDSGNYRTFVTLNRCAGRYPVASVKRQGAIQENVQVWCSNDYLAMSQHPTVIAAMQKAAARYGVGSGGSRSIGGTHEEVAVLETEIADWFDKERALVFPTGYGSNDATLEALSIIYPGLLIYSDALNHASMISGIRRNKNGRRIWHHSDLAHLEELLAADKPDVPKVIALESVYSMDGDVADIAGIISLARRYNALTYMDEVHAIGLYGSQGRGIADSLGLLDQVDLIEGTMAKSIGVIGGFIAGRDWLVDAVRSFAPGFIFTTSIPPAVAAACRTSIRIVRSDDHARALLQARTAELRHELGVRGIKILPSSTTHVLPVLVGDAALCRKAAATLLDEYGIYIQPINPPSVPEGTSRFRINATPAHTHAQVVTLADALQEVFARLGVPSLTHNVAA